MRRVSVVGTSGAGKSTVARELAAIIGVPHIELDGTTTSQAGSRFPRRNCSGSSPRRRRRRTDRARYGAAASDPANAYLRFVRLSSRGEVSRFLEEARRQAARAEPDLA